MPDKTIAQNQKTDSKTTHSASRSQKEAPILIQETPQNAIHNLQRTIGNQAVERLYRSGLLQAKLQIGSPNNKYEQKADRIADPVLRIPETEIHRQPEKEEEKTIQTKQIARQTKVGNLRTDTVIRMSVLQERMERKQPILQMRESPLAVHNKVTNSVVQCKKFRPVVGTKAQIEFNRLKAYYKRRGHSKEKAAHYAVDRMFGERVKETGGRWIKQKSFPKIRSMIYVRHTGRYKRVGIDYKSYNCHCFTFTKAKGSKLYKLMKLKKKIPSGSKRGWDYWELADLARNKVHYERRFRKGQHRMILFPKWIQDPSEVQQYLRKYRQRRTFEKLRKYRAIAIYNLNNQKYVHSGIVSHVDRKGNPTKVKSKWGHYSIFEHKPKEVPAHYGSPTYYLKK